MKGKEIANAIEAAYIKHQLERNGMVEKDFNFVDEVTTNMGIELNYLLSDSRLCNDPFTDWSMSLYNWQHLVKELLVLVGKPGILEHFHETTQPSVSTDLMKLLNFFQMLGEDKEVSDWLSWLMFKQFQCKDDYSEKEKGEMLRHLKVNP